MLSVGKYVATVADYYIHITSKEDPAPRIIFQVKMPDGSMETVTWTGSFKEGKAREFAMKALLTVGFDGPLVQFAEGPSSKAIDLEHQVEIDVIHEAFVTDKGETKMAAKVNWINPVGGGKFRKAMSSTDFAFCVKTMGLDNSFKAIAKMNGFTPEKKKEEVSLNDIPF